MTSSLVGTIRCGMLLILGLCSAAYSEVASGQTVGANEFVWSYNGPVAGKICVKVDEPSEPRRHAWGDNYLCSRSDWRLRWSYRGEIAGMRCTQINEPSEPNRRDWDDNYLCLPENSPLFLYWSHAGNDEHENCVRINEPSEPARHDWDDNYLCVVDERAMVTREDWAGSYRGVTDGKKTLLNVRANARLGNRGLTLEILDAGTRGVVSRAEVRMQRGDRTHELRNVEFRWVDEPARAPKVYPGLYLHTWNKQLISGYSQSGGKTYGAIFHADGFESSLNPRPYRTGTSKQEICNWTGDFEGYLDGRPLTIRVGYQFSRDYRSVADASLNFQVGDVRYSKWFYPARPFDSGVNPAAHHYRLNSISASRSGSSDRSANMKWPDFHLHTWDTSYISGTSEWHGREFGIAFKRVGSQEAVDAAFQSCLATAIAHVPPRPGPEPEPEPEPRRAVCEDGVDNDRDGLVDFPADPGCESRTDSNEFNPSFARHSELEVANCHSARGVIHVWRRDVTSGGSWSEVGSSPHQYDSSGTCPRAGARWIEVSLPVRDHIYDVRAVSPTATGCGGRNDPTYVACQRDSGLFQADSGAPVGRAIIY